MVTQPKDEVQKAMAALEKVLAKKHAAGEMINRSGDQIVIPSYMSLPDAAKSIEQYFKSQEEDTSCEVSQTCHPDDGLVCFYNSLKSTFGAVFGAETVFFTMFGEVKTPPRQKTISINYDENVTVPYGTIQVMGLPIKIIVRFQENDDDPAEGSVEVEFSYPRKFEPIVKDIIKTFQDELAYHSIFCGKAIDSNFKFINLSTNQPPVYSRTIESAITANILVPIAYPARLTELGLPVKRTVLLEGPYGTGKSLSALMIAKVAVQNKWTFMNVRPGDDIKRSLQFAQRYQPCVLFFEDIDSITNTDRDDKLNAILNTTDGILSKGAQVITILTTNHVENIHPAMLRPGRIDITIRLGELDEYAVGKLLQQYLNGDAATLDVHAITEEAKIFTPAFMVEALKRTTLYALGRAQGGEISSISTDDVINSLRGLQSQFDLTRRDDYEGKASGLDAMVQVWIDQITKQLTRQMFSRLKACAVAK